MRPALGRGNGPEAFMRFAAILIFILNSASCSKPSRDADSRVTTSAHAPTSVKPEAASHRPVGPQGSIEGSVTFTGAAPKMRKLRTGSDPICARHEKFAETVVVNPNATLRDVIVRVKPKTVPAWVPSEFVTLEQKDCVFLPRVQGAVTGQTLEVFNRDATLHNVHLRSMLLSKRQGHKTIINRPQIPGSKSMRVTLGDDEVVRIKCDVHPWMTAFIILSDQPYFSVTDATGHFAITDAPVGELEIQAWHPYYGLKSAKVQVVEGQVLQLGFSFDATDDDPMKE